MTLRKYNAKENFLTSSSYLCARSPSYDGKGKNKKNIERESVRLEEKPTKKNEKIQKSKIKCLPWRWVIVLKVIEEA